MHPGLQAWTFDARTHTGQARIQLLFPTRPALGFGASGFRGASFPALSPTFPPKCHRARRLLHRRSPETAQRLHKLRLGLKTFPETRKLPRTQLQTLLHAHGQNISLPENGRHEDLLLKASALEMTASSAETQDRSKYVGNNSI